jgi:hypothetical protein
MKKEKAPCEGGKGEEGLLGEGTLAREEGGRGARLVKAPWQGEEGERGRCARAGVVEPIEPH